MSFLPNSGNVEQVCRQSSRASAKIFRCGKTRERDRPISLRISPNSSWKGSVPRQCGALLSPGDFTGHRRLPAQQVFSRAHTKPWRRIGRGLCRRKSSATRNTAFSRSVGEAGRSSSSFRIHRPWKALLWTGGAFHSKRTRTASLPARRLFCFGYLGSKPAVDLTASDRA